MRALIPCLVISFLIAGTARAQQEPVPVVVGSKKFTESVILAEVVVHLLETEGHAARHRSELGGTRFLWDALLAGDVDAYPEYSGTILQELLAGEGVDGTTLQEALARRDVRMTAPLGFDNTYALGMREERAARLGIETISDLRAHADLRFGFSNEFMDREDGWPGLRARYGLPQTRVRGLDHDLAYRGLESGTLDVVDLYATDAEIAYYDLRVLDDDLAYFPSYEALILYRADLSERAPGAAAALERLAGRLDADRMRRLNMRAKIDRIPETQVAATFVEETFELGRPIDVDEAGWTTRLWQRTKEHLFLVVVSLGAAVAVAIPLGVVAAKYARTGQVILAVVGVIYTIPALALLVFMIPLLGIGGPPAMVALFLYSLLPIVRNTHAGLNDIPGPTVESAEALGLSPGARLRLVELPLAARSILAGVKTSAIINVGTATLGALIGAGGYGQPILTGIRLDDVGLILEGAVPAAVLALAVQGLFELAERCVVPAGVRA